MRPIPRSALPYLLAFTLVGLAYVSYASSSRSTEATASPRPLHLRFAARGATCGLPVGKQVEAVKAFRDMMPVFEHDRCMNCHGKFNVLSANDHTGAAVANASKLDPTQFLTVPQRIAFHQGCGDCHSQIRGRAIRRQLNDSTTVSGWMLPPAPMRWVGKDSEQLCVLMKGFEENADSFISHVRFDHGEVQFVEAAFEGKRALDSANMELYDVVAEPPPGSWASLIAQGSKWARLVGDHWKDSPECGCVMPKLKLNVHHTWLMDTPGGVPSRQASDAQFDVDLEPYGDDRPGYFTGQFSLTRRVDMTVPSFCTAQAAVKERWQFNAVLDEQTGSLQIWHTQLSEEPTGDIVCRQGGGTARMNADIGALAGLVGAGDMIIPPADSIGRKQASMQGLRETLTIIVRARP